MVGDAAGGEGASRSEFTAEWDMQLAAELLPIWIERKYVSGSMIEVDDRDNP